MNLQAKSKAFVTWSNYTSQTKFFIQYIYTILLCANKVPHWLEVEKEDHGFISMDNIFWGLQDKI